ncbi:flagellar biosynthetic protein FliO [Alkalimarinus coralli]|uniref:flagellar biosynthetic protein FliO n=1 Tax=Alkalimarinus coralli TaxID=2935863 RepID=UPI00202B31C2|nr:flagellar biosynthetic protein FliO [Alkalimarinus coralli]
MLLSVCLVSAVSAVESTQVVSKASSERLAAKDAVTRKTVVNSDDASVEVAEPAPPAANSKRAPSPGIDSTAWLNAVLGLVAVIALIFAIAWFVKRFTGLAVSNQQQMKIISAIPVGAKERIALIEVADKQLLVGITQHNINLLHSFDEPVVNKNDKTAVDFSSRLQAILSKGSAE